MPTVLRQDGFRFFFFSNENEEPPHIHVERGDGVAKFWLVPEIALAWKKGLRSPEVKKAFRIATDNQDYFLERWNEFFEEKA